MNVTALSYLDVLVPAARDNDGVLVVGGEPHAGHPVTVTLLLDGVLALGKGVPELDGLVPGSRDNLAVVGGEGDAHDILGVVLEAASGLAGGKIPQTQGLVPGAGEREVTVRGQDDVGDEVAVSVETLLGDAVVHVIPGELPDDERLVPGGGQDHLGILGIGGDLGDPAIVAAQGSTELKSFRHVRNSKVCLPSGFGAKNRQKFGKTSVSVATFRKKD